VQPKRFSTWFFVAHVPEDLADVQVDGNEIVEHVWMAAAAALEHHADGKIDLAPPTWVTLHQLAEHATAADVLASPRPLEKFATAWVGGQDAPAVDAGLARRRAVPRRRRPGRPRPPPPPLDGRPPLPLRTHRLSGGVHGHVGVHEGRPASS
jgi:hypothetical protein